MEREKQMDQSSNLDRDVQVIVIMVFVIITVVLSSPNVYNIYIQEWGVEAHSANYINVRFTRRSDADIFKHLQFLEYKPCRLELLF